jgi:hypothetical protein
MESLRFNPLVSKKYLILLAGAMWCGVGVMLITYAITWLSSFRGEGALWFYLAGFAAAMPIHHFGFLKLAGKNIDRLLQIEGKHGLFNFITPRSYLIIIVMVALGITLRHSSIPKQYLSIIYNGIGLGLFLSGIRYFRYFLMLLMKKEITTKDKDSL